MNIEPLFLKALLSTILVETAVLLAFVRLFNKEPFKNISTPQLLAAGFFASFSTLPYLWFILPVFFKSYMVLTVIGECLVTLTEGVFYGFFLRIRLPLAMLLSIICNAVSILFGLAFF